MNRRFASSADLLNDMLNCHEARPVASKVLAYLDEAGFESARDRDACLEQLKAVERAGGVTIARQRIDGVDQIKHVRLADPAPVYDYLGRIPAGIRAAAALRPLRERAGGTVEVSAMFDEVEQAWARNVSSFGIAPGCQEDLTNALELALALRARIEQPEVPQIDYRSFSRAFANDSKALERLATTVAQLLRRLAPEEIKPGAETSGEVIADFGVMRLPQPLILGGPLTMDGRALPRMPYVGIPLEEAPRIDLTCRPTYTLIIENFTSFVRHTREVNGDGSGLLIFSGGFPSREGRKAIVTLAASANAPTFHWGDLDEGGVRIFLHLETALAARGVRLVPHLMDADILKRYGARSRVKVRGAASVASASAISALWQAMSSDLNGYELEQEALSPKHPSLIA